MLNPFIQDPSSIKEKRPKEIKQPLDAERLSTNPTERPHGAALWVGKLLIRMGKKLTDQDYELKSTQENA